MSVHEDSAFLRMFLFILGGLVAFTVIIAIAASLVTGKADEARGEDPRQRAAIADRIKPVGSVNVAPPPQQLAVAAVAAPKSGAEIAAAACNACHLTGVLEAPKTGDQAAWAQRFDAQGGLEGLVASVINGKGSMPPRGGAMISDDEVRAAVEYYLGTAP